MSAHLGDRVSALLDGQLAPAESDRAWAHVHGCHLCRDAVEREGWVKTRLAGLSWGPDAAPDHLKGSLLGATAVGAMAMTFDDHQRRLGLIAIGGSAVGAAVLAVLAVGVGPADGPSSDRTPLTNFVGPTQPARTGSDGPTSVVDRVFSAR
jgi:hypothetical protein